MSRHLVIVDTTLRDGEQTAGVVFSNQEKLRIARLLDELGVNQIEAGVPVMGGDEKQAIRDIVKLGLKASIMGWNRAVVSDIEASLACGVDAVAISISTSDIHIEHKLMTTREDVLERMIKATSFAKREGIVYIGQCRRCLAHRHGFFSGICKRGQKSGCRSSALL